MNRRLLFAVVFSVWISSCEGAGGDVTRVELIELTGLEVDGGGAFNLASNPVLEVTTQAFESESALLGSARSGGSLVRFRRSTRPAGNGGQLQDMTFERTDFGSAPGGVQVPFLPTPFCEPPGPCAPSYFADYVWPKVLKDGSVLMAVTMGTATGVEAEIFEPRHRLLRFDLDGGLLLNTSIPMAEGAGQALVTSLDDGTLVVSYSELEGQGSKGVSIELRAQDSGAISSTVTLDTVTIDTGADGGSQVPTAITPRVSRLVPLRNGGFLAVGHAGMNRNIKCGTQGVEPPSPGGCGQGIPHAMLVKFDKTGKQLWRRDLGRDFKQPGSYFVDATELSDGSLVATGHIEKRTGSWLDPDHGALVTRFSADGVIQRATRFCPCRQFLSGGADALASNPRPVGNGDYEVMFRDGKGLTTATRFNGANELIGAAGMTGPSIQQQFITTDSGWASFASGRTLLIHHELVPR